MDIKWSSSSHLNPSPNISGNPQLHKGFCRALRLRSSRRFQVFFPEVLHHSQEVLSGPSPVFRHFMGFFGRSLEFFLGGANIIMEIAKKTTKSFTDLRFLEDVGVRCSSYIHLFLDRVSRGRLLVFAKRNDTFLELSHVLSTFIPHHYSEV